QKGGYTPIQASLFTVNIRQCCQQPLAALFAKLAPKIGWKFPESAKILEQFAAFLKTFEVAYVHAVPQKSQLNGVKSVNGRAIRIEYYQSFQVLVTCHGDDLMSVMLQIHYSRASSHPGM
ncbi:MAG TPA: hypothetical protein VMJ33_10465, partial [Gallionella sp.]|nr:hypothetical protein [Gallionella sp.]